MSGTCLVLGGAAAGGLHGVEETATGSCHRCHNWKAILLRLLAVRVSAIAFPTCPTPLPSCIRGCNDCSALSQPTVSAVPPPPKTTDNPAGCAGHHLECGPVLEHAGGHQLAPGPVGELDQHRPHHAEHPERPQAVRFRVCSHRGGRSAPGLPFIQHGQDAEGFAKAASHEGLFIHLLMMCALFTPAGHYRSGGFQGRYSG